MHTDAKYLKKLPFIINSRTFDKIVSIVKLLEQTRYMSDEGFEAVESLNDVVYETYDIGRAESGYIDAKMREVQSEKWDYNRQK